MRYLIIDRDYCVFMTNAINGKTQQALKDGKISIIDVKKMEGMALNGLDMEPVQYWSDKMIDAPIESGISHTSVVRGLITALEGMVAIQDEPFELKGLYGKAMDAAIEAQCKKVEERTAIARAALLQAKEVRL